MLNFDGNLEKDLNVIEVQGPIVSKFHNEVATNLTIKTPRFNMPNVAKGGEACYNYPMVSFYGPEKDKIAETYQEGDTVHVTGTIQTQRKIQRDTGRYFHDQRLIGLSIEEADKELEIFGLDNGGYVAADSKVYLVGTVSRISTPARGVLSVNIRTFTEGYVNNIQAFMYTREVGNYMEMIRTGDRVCAVGKIQTSKKTLPDESNRYYRNIVLNSLSKC